MSGTVPPGPPCWPRSEAERTTSSDSVVDDRGRNDPCVADRPVLRLHRRARSYGEEVLAVIGGRVIVPVEVEAAKEPVLAAEDLIEARDVLVEVLLERACRR